MNKKMKLEKVIEGLEEMLEESKYNDSVQYNPWADTKTLEAALAMLKSQGPRVMTLEEINAVKQNDVLVYESNAAFKAIFHFIVTEGVVDNELRIKTEFERIDMAAPLETYNRVWRCWTSRPTDEQREAVKWDNWVNTMQ